ARLASNGSFARPRQTFRDATDRLFIGSASSYYSALAPAATWGMLRGQRGRAIPASELLLFPDLVLAGSGKVAAAVISRSGRTSETVRAAEFLENEKDIRTLAVDRKGVV